MKVKTIQTILFVREIRMAKLQTHVRKQECEFGRTNSVHRLTFERKKRIMAENNST